MGEVQRHHQHVGDALGAFALEVVLGHPERVVAVADPSALAIDSALLQRGGEVRVVVYGGR